MDSKIRDLQGRAHLKEKLESHLPQNQSFSFSPEFTHLKAVMKTTLDQSHPFVLPAKERVCGKTALARPDLGESGGGGGGRGGGSGFSIEQILFTW